MKYHSKLVACLFLALCLPNTAAAADIPQQLQAAVLSAQADGAALYRAASAASTVDDKVVSEAKSRVSDFCEFAYKPVVVRPGDGSRVYFIAQPQTAGSSVFGRHYRVDEKGVTPSTKSCLAYPPAPDGAVASFVTHLLSETPTEFHVYVSLKDKRPVYVGTSAGNWVVDGEKIMFMGPRNGT